MWTWRPRFEKERGKIHIILFFITDVTVESSPNSNTFCHPCWLYWETNNSRVHYGRYIYSAALNFVLYYKFSRQLYFKQMIAFFNLFIEYQHHSIQLCTLCLKAQNDSKLVYRLFLNQSDLSFFGRHLKFKKNVLLI